MAIEQLIIAAARIAGSLPVLRWAFFGAILAIVVDFSDLFMMNLIDFGEVWDYQTFDKWIDQVYMLTFLWVAVRQWDGPGRTVAVWLFAFRAIGFIAFEFTGDRAILFLFPNVFEFWFVAIAAQRHWWQDYELTPPPNRHHPSHLHRTQTRPRIHPPHLASPRQLHRRRRSNHLVELPHQPLLNHTTPPISPRPHPPSSVIPVYLPVIPAHPPSFLRIPRHSCVGRNPEG